MGCGKDQDGFGNVGLSGDAVGMDGALADIGSGGSVDSGSIGPADCGEVGGAALDGSVEVGGQQACPSDMVLIEGDYCPFLEQPCMHNVKGGVKRCARFGRSRCVGKTYRRRFCIDRYEYPNIEGMKPAVMVSWYDAVYACEVEGKRLCLASEWTLACEGVERSPYPYGFVRDSTVCNFDRERIVPEPRLVLFSQPRSVGAEVARLDMRVASGEQEGCVSSFGVRDMTGNVDEWVINEDYFSDKPEKTGYAFLSGLKGGYWGPIRAACRPMTTAHEETFRFYQIGFRCCASTSLEPDGVYEQYAVRMKRWFDRVR